MRWRGVRKLDEPVILGGAPLLNAFISCLRRNITDGFAPVKERLQVMERCGYKYE